MFKDSKFNLIELIIVIAIIGILAYCNPNISDFSIKAKDTRRMADIKNSNGCYMYYAKNNGEYLLL